MSFLMCGKGGDGYILHEPPVLRTGKTHSTRQRIHTSTCYRLVRCVSYAGAIASLCFSNLRL